MATAFQLERDLGITQALNDLSWLMTAMPYSQLIAENAAFTYTISSCNRLKKMYPHFIGRHGAFAWNEPLTFWLSPVAFAVQFFTDVCSMLKVIEMGLLDKGQ